LTEEEKQLLVQRIDSAENLSKKNHGSTVLISRQWYISVGGDGGWGHGVRVKGYSDVIVLWGDVKTFFVAQLIQIQQVIMLAKAWFSLPMH